MLYIHGGDHITFFSEFIYASYPEKNFLHVFGLRKKPSYSLSLYRSGGHLLKLREATNTSTSAPHAKLRKIKESEGQGHTSSFVYGSAIVCLVCKRTSVRFQVESRLLFFFQFTLTYYPERSIFLIIVIILFFANFFMLFCPFSTFIHFIFLFYTYFFFLFQNNCQTSRQ